MEKVKQKIISIVLLVTMAIIFAFSFSACEGCACSCMNSCSLNHPTPVQTEPMTELEWIAMWENTKYEMTKANANFKVVVTFDREDYRQSTDYYIVDSNKGLTRAYTSGREPFRRYFSLDNKGVLFYFGNCYLDGGTVKIPTGYTETMGKTMWGTSIHNMFMNAHFPPHFNRFIDNFSHMRYLGGHRYVYSASHSWGGMDIYTEWIISETSGLVSQISTRQVYFDYRYTIPSVRQTHNIIFGGQNIVLPDNYCVAVRLQPPTNLKINDGILTWDEVEGANGFLIYVESNYFQRQRARFVGGLEFDIFRLFYSSSLNEGEYRITLYAVSNNIRFLSSLSSEPIYFYFARNFA